MDNEEKDKSPYTHRVVTYLPKKYRDKLDGILKNTDIKEAQLIRQIIIDYLNKK